MSQCTTWHRLTRATQARQARSRSTTEELLFLTDCSQQAHSAAAGSAGGILDKTKEATNAAVTKVQEASSPYMAKMQEMAEPYTKKVQQAGQPNMEEKHQPVTPELSRHMAESGSAPGGPVGPHTSEPEQYDASGKVSRDP